MPHLHEKIDFTVQALIVHEGRVLLRMHDKYGTWLPVGGHIELDEDPVEALFREVKEESGLEIELLGGRPEVFPNGITRLPAPHFLQRMPIGSTHEHVDMVYVARAMTLEIKPAPSEKDVEFRWFGPGELSDPDYRVQAHIRVFAAEAIRLASG